MCSVTSCGMPRSECLGHCWFRCDVVCIRHPDAEQRLPLQCCSAADTQEPWCATCRLLFFVLTRDGRRAYFGTAVRDSTADTIKAGSIAMFAARDALPCREANSSRWEHDVSASCSAALLLAHVAIQHWSTCHHTSKTCRSLQPGHLQLKQAKLAPFLYCLSSILVLMPTGRSP